MANNAPSPSLLDRHSALNENEELVHVFIEHEDPHVVGLVGIEALMLLSRELPPDQFKQFLQQSIARSGQVKQAMQPAGTQAETPAQPASPEPAAPGPAAAAQAPDAQAPDATQGSSTPAPPSQPAEPAQPSAPSLSPEDSEAAIAKIAQLAGKPESAVMAMIKQIAARMAAGGKISSDQANALIVRAIATNQRVTDLMVQALKAGTPAGTFAPLIANEISKSQ